MLPENLKDSELVAFGSGLFLILPCKSDNVCRSAHPHVYVKP